MQQASIYQRWLGLSGYSSDRPNHYHLLGLEQFEADLGRISRAAEQQLSRLLANSPQGDQRSDWQRLVNELAEAQSILTHPEHKAKYDNELRSALKMNSAVELAKLGSLEQTKGEQPSLTTSAQSTIPQSPMNPAWQSQPQSAPNQPTAASGQPVAPGLGQAVPVGQTYSAPQYQQPSYPQQPPQLPNYQAPTQQPPLQLLGVDAHGQPIYGYSQPQYGQPPASNYPPMGQQPPAYPPQAYPLQPPVNYGQPAYAPAASVYQPVPPYQQSPAYPQASVNSYPAPQMANPMAPVNLAPHNNLASHNVNADPMAPVALHGGNPRSQASPWGNVTHSTAPATSNHPTNHDQGNAIEFGSSSSAYRVRRNSNSLIWLGVAAIAMIAIIITAIALNSPANRQSNDDPIVATKQSPKPAPKKLSPSATPVSVPVEPAEPATNPQQPVVPAPQLDSMVKPNMPSLPTDQMPANTMPAGEMPMPMKPEPAMPANSTPPAMPDKPAMPEQPIAPAMPDKPTTPVTPPAVPQPDVVASLPNKPEPAMPAKPEPAPEVKATKEQVKALTDKLALVRTALNDRDFTTAKKELALAEKLAVTPELEDTYLGMKLVLDYNEEFWNSLKKAMMGLQGEITIGSSIANIVYADEREITIRINGGNKNYKFNSIPAGLAMAILKRWFDDSPANKAIMGAYYYVSKPTAPDEAKAFWTEAQQKGVDTKLMLQLLDKPGLGKK